MTVTCEKCHESVCPVCKELCSEDDTSLVRASVSVLLKEV